jgi:hypothetical protein
MRYTSAMLVSIAGILLSFFSSSAWAAEPDCSEPFQPAKYIGKDSNDFYWGPCFQLKGSWAVDPYGPNFNERESVRFDITHLSRNSKDYFILEKSVFQGHKMLTSIIVDYVEVEQARQGENIGYMPSVFCWEKGGSRFPDRNSVDVFARSGSDAKNKLVPLEYWRVDKQADRIVQGSISEIACGRPNGKMR